MFLSYDGLHCNVSGHSGAGAVPDAEYSAGQAAQLNQAGNSKSDAGLSCPGCPYPALFVLAQTGRLLGRFPPLHIWRQLLADNENTCVLTAQAKRHGNILMLLYIQ